MRNGWIKIAKATQLLKTLYEALNYRRAVFFTLLKVELFFGVSAPMKSKLIPLKGRTIPKLVFGCMQKAQISLPSCAV